MTQYRIYILSLMILLITVVGVSAQKINVKPATVNIKDTEHFNLEYELDHPGVGNFQAPDLSEFRVISGPNFMMGRSNVNGKVTSVTKYSFILVPLQSGEFTIKPATATYQGKKIKSAPVKVSVSGVSGGGGSGRKNPAFKPKINSGSSGSSGGQGYGKGYTPPVTSRTPKSRAITGNDELFMRIYTDTTTIYQGQQITINYRLYTTLDIVDYNIKATPALTGLWVQDITPSRINTGGAVTIDSVRYRIYDLKTYAVFPQRSGTLKLDPMPLEITTKQAYTSGQSRWHRAFGNKNFDLTQDTVLLNVLEFPEKGKPASFSGAVGDFTIDMTTSKATVKVNESVKVGVTISGKGNIKLINLPEVDFGENFESFDPIASEDVFQQRSAIKGRKKYEYDIIPQKIGKHDIPEIEFSFFDPEKKRYKTVKTKRVTLNVEVGEGGQESTQAVDALLDIHPIRERAGLSKSGGFAFFNSPAFWLSMSIPLFIFPVFLRRHKKQAAELADVETYKRKNATKVAVQRLKAAEKHMKSKDKKAFYDEVVKSVWGYLSDRVNIKTGELGKENIAKVLKEKGVTDDTNVRLLNIIRYCEMAIFAPVADADNLKGTYDDSVSIITQIEEEITKETLVREAEARAKARERAKAKAERAKKKKRKKVKKVKK